MKAFLKQKNPNEITLRIHVITSNILSCIPTGSMASFCKQCNESSDFKTVRSESQILFKKAFVPRNQSYIAILCNHSF